MLFLILSTDPDTLAEIIEWREPLDAWTTNTIGKTHVLLDGSRENCRARECSFGNKNSWVSTPQET